MSDWTLTYRQNEMLRQLHDDGGESSPLLFDGRTVRSLLDAGLIEQPDPGYYWVRITAAGRDAIGEAAPSAPADQTGKFAD